MTVNSPDRRGPQGGDYRQPGARTSSGEGVKIAQETNWLDGLFGSPPAAEKPESQPPAETKQEAVPDTVDLSDPKTKSKITVDFTGVDQKLRPGMKQQLEKILKDPAFKASLAGRNLTVNFKELADIKGRPPLGLTTIVDNGKKNPSDKGKPHKNVTVTFNTRLLNSRGGEAYLGEKPFKSVAVHESMHVRFPNLSGDSENGHDHSLGDYLFRTMTTKVEKRLFGSAHSSERGAQKERWDEVKAADPSFEEIETEDEAIAAMNKRNGSLGTGAQKYYGKDHPYR
jgi:hypothetical protein